GELIQRVERQELQAIALVQGVGRDPGVDRLHSPLMARVPIRDRGSEQRPIAIQEAAVDAPSIDPDTLQVVSASRRRAKAGKDLSILTERGPTEALRQLHGLVRKSMDFLEQQRVRSDVADDHPPGRRAEIDGADRSFGAHLRNAAATPASTGTWSPVVCDRSPPTSANTAAATCSGRTSFLSKVR